MLRGNWKGVDEVNLLLAELNQTHGLDLKLTASEIRDRVLGLDIEEFEPSTGTYNCLKSEGIHTVGDLIAKTAEELLLVLRGSRRRLEEARGLLQQVNKTYNLNPALELRPGDSPFL
ncbi:MAG TPA: DNA-directed RNA polymerase subunit alpha C-terminal domain-containing protein [Candidatus Saccharimonadia bacterium]|nr:DNA-directed RNA polymerase subunit alpha C-terminal domain-containing protein [Candidatus Saccharimonadia bacterium]